MKSFAARFTCRPVPTTSLFRHRNGSLPCAACGGGVVSVSTRLSADMWAVGNRRWCRIRVIMHTIVGDGKSGRRGVVDSIQIRRGG